MPLFNPFVPQAGAGLRYANTETLAADESLVPRLTDTFDLGSPTHLYRKGWLSELDAVLFAENTITLLGGWFYVTKDQGTLKADVAAAHSQVDFGKTMTPGHFVVLRASLKVEYLQVGSLVGGTVYNVTRNLDGSGANDWPAGTPFAVLGTTGDGRIELNAYDTPRISLIEQGAAYNAQTERVRLGDMANWQGLGLTGWGWGVGEATKHAYYTPGSGLVVRGTVRADAGYLGSLSIDGVLGIGPAGELRQGTGSLGTNFTGLRIWRESDIGRVAGYNNNIIQWEGRTDGRFYAGAGNVRISNTGVQVKCASTDQEGVAGPEKINFFFTHENPVQLGELTTITAPDDVNHVNLVTLRALRTEIATPVGRQGGRILLKALSWGTVSAASIELGVPYGSGGSGNCEAWYNAALHTFSGPLAIGSAPSQTGLIRLSNSQGLWWRNAANNGDIEALRVGTTNQIHLGAPIRMPQFISYIDLTEVSVLEAPPSGWGRVYFDSGTSWPMFFNDRGQSFSGPMPLGMAYVYLGPSDFYSTNAELAVFNNYGPYRDFATGGVRWMDYSMPFPRDWGNRSLSVKVLWYPSNNNAGNVVWQYEIRRARIGSAYDGGAYGGTYTVTTAVPLNSANVTFETVRTGIWMDGAMAHGAWSFRLFRRPLEGDDTYNGSARVIAVILSINSNVI